MEQSKNELQSLLRQYFNGSISTDEEQALWAYFSDDVYSEELESALPDAFSADQQVPQNKLSDLQNKRILNYIFNYQQETKPVAKTVKLWPKLKIVAAVASICFCLGIYKIVQQYKQNSDEQVAAQRIHPGKFGATLTLGNGKKIVLSEQLNGKLAEEANATITKGADGFVVYKVKENAGSNTEASFNTLATANGETYKIILPDQSVVWLNAASSLKYPSYFSPGKNTTRNVELTGEAYFEVSKDKAHPFIVKTAEQEVEVLGTHFNINAYRNEAHVTTTLVEGSVRVHAAGSTVGEKEVLLKPNEQSVLTGKNFVLKSVDASDAIAWKNGYFMFNSEELGSIMNRISRWYNVKVVFEDEDLKKRTFFGSIGRFENITKVLDVLKRTNVANFTISDNTITIKRK